MAVAAMGTTRGRPGPPIHGGSPSIKTRCRSVWRGGSRGGDPRRHALARHLRRSSRPLERKEPQEGDLRAGSRSWSIAFVIGGMLGVKKPANQNELRRRVRARRPARRPALPQAEQRERPRPGARRRSCQRRVRPPGGTRRVAAVGAKPRVADVKSPFAKGNATRSPRTAGPSWSPSRCAATRRDSREGDRPDRRRRRRRVQRANPAVSVGQFGDASANKALSKSFAGRLQEGREALAPDHADHPGARVRRARRRRHPAAAGPDGGHGHARPHRDARARSSRWTTRSARSCCSSAWRWASTTRSSTCAASARRGPRRRQARGRAHRRRHVGARGPGLRLHGHGRHGRHVPGRRGARSPRSASARSWSSPSR